MFPWDRYSAVCEARALFKITSFCDYTTITSFPLPSPLSKPSPIPFSLLPFKFMAPFNCCYICIGCICFCVYVCVYTHIPDTYIPHAQPAYCYVTCRLCFWHWPCGIGLFLSLSGFLVACTSLCRIDALCPPPVSSLPASTRPLSWSLFSSCSVNHVGETFWV